MLTRRSFLRSALAGGLAAPFAAKRAAPSAAGEGVELGGWAHSDELVEFISVQAQINRGNPVWNRPDWRPLLGRLGIRHVRCNLAGRRARDHMAALHGEYGIRACGLVTAINDDGSFDFARTAQIVAFMRDEIGPEKIRAVEGPNEYTHRHKTDGWAARLRDYQEFVFTAFRSDPALGSLPVLAPTIWRRVAEDQRAIAILGDHCDYGNLHLYSGGRRPGIFRRDGRDEPMDVAIDEAGFVTPGRRICVTETGFSVGDGSGSSSDVPPDVAARYTLRNIAELFLRRARVAWVNIYTLMDHTEGSDYGLADLDLTPRHPFAALRNLVALAADRGPAPVEAGEMPCRLHASSPDIRRVCLHKRDGTRLIMLWRDVDSFDRRTRKVIESRPEPAMLDFGDRRIGSVLVHAPTISARPVEEHRSVASLELSVPDHVLVVELAA